MKTRLFLFAFFFVNSISCFAQISQKTIVHYFKIKGEEVPYYPQYLFEVKDSSLIVLPFQHIDFFKTIKDSIILNKALQNIKTGNSPIKLAEVPISSIDKIIRNRRYRKGINTMIGFGVGLIAGGLYLAADYHPESINHGYRIMGSIVIVGGSTLMGVIIPSVKKRFYIGRSQKKFETLKQDLRTFSILQ